MFIVTGTKRSGTSLWMQILRAAGIPVIGEAFPANWSETLHGANRDGFFESSLREGVYWRTNPHPKTGTYLTEASVRGHAVKVFIPGLVRTERAYIEKVIATVRHWAEYDQSLRRLYAMEDDALEPGVPPPVRRSPVLEWWEDNYSLLRNVAIRGFPIRIQSYDGLLEDPERVVAGALEFLGGGKVPEAVATVKQERRTQDRATIEAPTDELDAAAYATFDRLFEVIDQRQPLTPALLEELNRRHQQLVPILRKERERLQAERMHRAATLQGRSRDQR